MLEVRELHLALPDRSVRRPFRRAPRVDILRGVSFHLTAGRTLGVVGESGSGKTSLARTVLRLHRPSGGQILLQGRDIAALDEAALRPLRAQIQMIFQNPLSSLNPRHRIGAIVSQPLALLGPAGGARVRGARARRSAAEALLERVGLPSAFVTRYPHELSGGERQRVGIARAIALRPAIVVADEIVSGLDVSTQAQIIALLRALRTDMGLALMFISHDLSVVRALCDEVLVLQDGKVVEQGACAEVFARPRAPYTRRLLEAIPLPEVDPGWIERAGVDDD